MDLDALLEWILVCSKNSIFLVSSSFWSMIISFFWPNLYNCYGSLLSANKTHKFMKRRARVIITYIAIIHTFGHKANVWWFWWWQECMLLVVNFFITWACHIKSTLCNASESLFACISFLLLLASCFHVRIIFHGPVWEHSTPKTTTPLHHLQSILFGYFVAPLHLLLWDCSAWAWSTAWACGSAWASSPLAAALGPPPLQLLQHLG